MVESESDHSDHSIGTPDIPTEQLDAARAYDPVLNLVWGERLLEPSLEGRKGALVRSAHTDDRYMIVELEGGVAEDLNREQGIIPDAGHDFRLRAFPHGVTVHHIDGYPDEAEILEAMREQARFNAELENQVADRMDPQERAAYRRTERHPELVSDLLLNPNLVREQTDGIRWFYVGADNFRARGAIEVPTAKVHEALPFELHDVRTMFTQVVGGLHSVELRYGANPGFDPHAQYDRIEGETATLASLIANKAQTVTDGNLTVNTSGAGGDLSLE